MAVALASTKAGGWVSPAPYPKLWEMHEWRPRCSPPAPPSSDMGCPTPAPMATLGEGSRGEGRARRGPPGGRREAVGRPAGSPRGRPACVAPRRRLPPSRLADGFQMTAPSREAPVPPQAAAPACFLPPPPRPPRPRPADGPGNASRSRRRCRQQAGMAARRALAKPKPTPVRGSRAPKQSPPSWGSSFFAHSPLLPQDSPGSSATESRQGFWITGMASPPGSSQRRQLVNKPSARVISAHYAKPM